MRKFSVHFSPLLFYTTLSVGVILLITLGYLVYAMMRTPALTPHIMVLVVLIVSLGLIAPLMKPSALLLSDEHLVIRRPMGDRVIARSEIVRVQRADSLRGSKRLLASGGFFGYIGWFRSYDRGRFFAYVTDTREMFWLRTRNRSYLLSCSDAQLLIVLLQNEEPSDTQEE